MAGAAMGLSAAEQKTAVHPQTGAPQSVERWGEVAVDGIVWVTAEAYAIRADAPLLGQVFDGRYAIYDARVLPNSIVYFAAHLHLDDDRHVVIKRVRPDHPHHELAVRRLRHEARFLARLPKHPNLPQLYDLVLVDDAYHLVMERAPGRALDTVLALTRTLPTPIATEVLLQVLDALAICHAAGVVHRDLKPSNILVHRDGDAIAVTLVDFGIAKDLVQRDVTDLGTRLQPGTPAYMSPEQAWNGAVTPSSDLYSATAVLHRMLTGKAPVRDGDDGMGGLTLDPDLSPSIAGVLQTGLALFPDGRFADCVAMQQALRGLTGDTLEPPPVHQTEGGTEHAPAVVAMPRPTRPVWPWMVAAVVLLAAIGFAVWPPSVVPATRAAAASVPVAVAPLTIDAAVADAAVDAAQPPPKDMQVDAAVVDAAPSVADAAPLSVSASKVAAAARRKNARKSRGKLKGKRTPKRVTKRPASPPPIPKAALQLASKIRTKYVERCQCGPAYGTALKTLSAMRGGEALIQARQLKGCVHLFSPDLQKCVKGRPVMKGDAP